MKVRCIKRLITVDDIFVKTLKAESVHFSHIYFINYDRPNLSYDQDILFHLQYRPTRHLLISMSYQ